MDLMNPVIINNELYHTEIYTWSGLYQRGMLDLIFKLFILHLFSPDKFCSLFGFSEYYLKVSKVLMFGSHSVFSPPYIYDG